MRPPVAVEHPKLLVADKPPFSHELCFSPTHCHGKFAPHNASGLGVECYYLTQSIRPSEIPSIFQFNRPVQFRLNQKIYINKGGNRR